MFVDTETTGLCDMRTPYTSQTLNEVWPFLTQIAWSIISYDENLQNQGLASSNSHFIKPRFSPSQLPQDVIDKTHITYNLLQEQGDDSLPILTEFFNHLTLVDAVVAHNTTFDMKVIKAEALRLGLDNHMRIKPWLDTCYYGLQLTKLKTPQGRSKFPKLQELYNFIEAPKGFPQGRIEDSSHRADADVNSLIICFDGLTQLPAESPVITPLRFQRILQKHSEKYQEVNV